MRTRVQIGPTWLEIRGGVWSSNDRQLADRIDATITSDDVIPYAPDDDYAMARIAAKVMGGEITEYDGPPGEGDPTDTVY
jgi:hypothetical protein